MKNSNKIIMLLLFCLVLCLFACPSLSEQQHTNSTNNNTQNRCEKIQKSCQSKKGSPYVWGAEGPDSFDCSGFIYYLMKRTGDPIPRTTARKYWIYFESDPVGWKDAECGSLIWWTLEKDRPKGHMGIMVKNPKFWQAGSSSGVYSRKFFEGSYWDKNFVGAKSSLD